MTTLALRLPGRLFATAFAAALAFFCLCSQAGAQSLQVFRDQQTPVPANSTLSFGTVPVGDQTGGTVTLTLRNPGNFPMILSGNHITGPHATDFSIVSAPTAPLAGGATANLTLRFRPAAAGGRSANLEIRFGNGEQTLGYNLVLGGTGTGSTGPVGPATNVITFPAFAPHKYGDEAFELEATASSGLPVSYTVKSGPAHLGESGTKLFLTGAGTVTIQARQNGGARNGVTYPAARSVTQRLTVAKAPLDVTVAPARKLRGAALPVPVLSYDGFIGSDTATRLTIPARSTTATTSSGAGEYPFTVDGTDANYTFNVSPSTLRVIDYSGTYEALLLTPDEAALPAAKLSLAVTTTHKLSGKLADGAEGTLFPLKSVGGGFALDTLTDDALATATIAVKPKGRPAFTYTVALRLSAAPTAAPVLAATLKVGEIIKAEATDGRLIVNKLKNYTADAYTLALDPPVALDPETVNLPPLPVGSGYALGALATNGALKLTGYLADGVKFTATVQPDATGHYRLFVLPYAKRPQSYLAGSIEPSTHPDLTGRRFVPFDSDQLLFWAKSANAKDKGFRTGFGSAPLAMGFTLDPWLPPSKRAPVVTLAQRLALAPDGAILPFYTDLDFDHEGANPRRIPTALQLDARNKVLVTTPVGSRAKASFKPATGEFTIGVTAAKLTIRGALRQPPSTEQTPVIGAGWESTPLVPSSAGTRFGDFRLERALPVSNQ